MSPISPILLIIDQQYMTSFPLDTNNADYFGQLRAAHRSTAPGMNSEFEVNSPDSAWSPEPFPIWKPLLFGVLECSTPLPEQLCNITARLYRSVGTYQTAIQHRRIFRADLRAQPGVNSSAFLFTRHSRVHWEHGRGRPALRILALQRPHKICRKSLTRYRRIPPFWDCFCRGAGNIPVLSFLRKIYVRYLRGDGNF